MEGSPLLVPSFVTFGIGMLLYFPGIGHAFGVMGGMLAMIAGAVMFVHALAVGGKK